MGSRRGTVSSSCRQGALQDQIRRWSRQVRFYHADNLHHLSLIMVLLGFLEFKVYLCLELFEIVTIKIVNDFMERLRRYCEKRTQIICPSVNFITRSVESVPFIDSFLHSQCLNIA
jgi:hypothetical protein